MFDESLCKLFHLLSPSEMAEREMKELMRQPDYHEMVSVNVTDLTLVDNIRNGNRLGISTAGFGNLPEESMEEEMIRAAGEAHARAMDYRATRLMEILINGSNPNSLTEPGLQHVGEMNGIHIYHQPDIDIYGYLDRWAEQNQIVENITNISTDEDIQNGNLRVDVTVRTNPVSGHVNLYINRSGNVVDHLNLFENITFNPFSNERNLFQ